MGMPARAGVGSANDHEENTGNDEELLDAFSVLEALESESYGTHDDTFERAICNGIIIGVALLIAAYIVVLASSL